MFGFLNAYKPKGITSHDVVAQLRRALNIKQIGHTGTLDPFAQGVLPICIGKATRLMEYLDDDKEYLATCQFGKSTDTFDVDGNFIFESNLKVAKEDVLIALKSFSGEILQVPPMYSAIKVGGKKLYEYAREGKQIDIQPRKVCINNIELKNFDFETQKAQILIACSKGTYIRSIANDLGNILGCGSYLTELVRTKAGKFDISTSLKEYTQNVEKNLINPLEVLSLPKLIISDVEHDDVVNGRSFINKSVPDNTFVILVYNNMVSAVACCNSGMVKVKKVFS